MFLSLHHFEHHITVVSNLTLRKIVLRASKLHIQYIGFKIWQVNTDTLQTNIAICIQQPWVFSCLFEVTMLHGHFLFYPVWGLGLYIHMQLTCMLKSCAMHCMNSFDMPYDISGLDLWHWEYRGAIWIFHCEQCPSVWWLCPAHRFISGRAWLQGIVCWRWCEMQGNILHWLISLYRIS